MRNLEALQKDPLWIKSCEMAKSLSFVVNEMQTEEPTDDLDTMRLYIRSVPRLIAEAILATNTENQALNLEAAIREARETDALLQKLATEALAAGKLENKAELSRQIFNAFAQADQLREMVFWARQEIEGLKSTA